MECLVQLEQLADGELSDLLAEDELLAIVQNIQNVELEGKWQQ